MRNCHGPNLTARSECSPFCCVVWSGRIPHLSPWPAHLTRAAARHSPRLCVSQRYATCPCLQLAPAHGRPISCGCCIRVSCGSRYFEVCVRPESAPIGPQECRQCVAECFIGPRQCVRASDRVPWCRPQRR
jgi:hypothetical protein